MKLVRGMPSDRSLPLYACDKEGRPVPRAGGVVHLNEWLWDTEYVGGKVYAVMQREPEVIVLSDDFTCMFVRYPVSTFYSHGVVMTSRGPVSGFIIPEPTMPESFDVEYLRDTLRFWEPTEFRYALLWRKH